MQLLSLLLLPLTLSTPLDNGFNLCTTPSDIYTVKSLSVGPNPVLVGQELKVNLTGTLNSPITNGSIVQISVRLGVISVFSSKIDLCKQESQVGKECPIAPGELDLSNGQTLPASAPAGKYNLTLVWKLGDGTPITCATGNLVISKP